MDQERMKAQIRRYLAQLNSFQSLLFNEYGKQPTWEVWADSCHEISKQAESLSEIAHDLAAQYELSLDEQERATHT